MAYIPQINEMGNPLFSIIVPAFNAEATLGRCVESILVQTITDFELIIVDDGSTDATLSICYHYATLDNRIFVYHKSNGGAGSARNFGIKHARGIWILFCDSDDFVYQNWISNFKSQITDDVDMTIQGFKTSKPIASCISKLEYGVDFTSSASEGIRILSEINLLGYTVVKSFRRELIEKFHLEFNEHLNLNEDGVFVIDYLSRAGNITSISTPGYYYFVPDWNKKYTGDDNLPIYFNYCDKFLQEGHKEAFNFFIHCSTEGLLDSYLTRSPKRSFYLKQYSNISNKYLVQKKVKIKHPVFDKFKWILLFDRLYITSFILDVIVFFKHL